MEVHVDDIPHDELVEMITKRCSVAPSRSERIVGVMRELHRRRQRSDLFAGRHAFITPRDLFRWAERAAATGTDSYGEVAREGYMLLAEGLRRPEDRQSLQEVLELQMKAKVDTKDLYQTGWLDDLRLMIAERGGDATVIRDNMGLSGMVTTGSTRRMVKLLSRCVKRTMI